MTPIWTDHSTNPGVPEAALAAWSRHHGRTFPNALAELLREHDGGVLEREWSEWVLLPLAEMKPVDSGYVQDVWQMHDTMEEWRAELAESGLAEDVVLFPFLREGNSFYWFAWLDGSPEAVMIKRHWDDGRFSRPQSLDTWCRESLAPVPSAQPGVDWNEVFALEIIFEEKCPAQGPIEMHQVLGRKEGKLWLYVHEVLENDGELENETYTKYFIPEPLDPAHCDIAKSGSSWSLALVPSDDGEYVKYESRRNGRSKGWLDVTEDAEEDVEGAGVASPDRGRIEALRSQLFDEEAIAKADEKARREEEKRARMQSRADRFEAGLSAFSDLTAAAGSINRLTERRIPPEGKDADLLAAMQAYCSEQDIELPPRLAGRAPKSHVIVKRHFGLPGMLAMTWDTLEDAAAFIRQNPASKDGTWEVEILDFAGRSRYGWSAEGPVLQGNF